MTEQVWANLIARATCLLAIVPLVFGDTVVWHGTVLEWGRVVKIDFNLTLSPLLPSKKGNVSRFSTLPKSIEKGLRFEH